MKTHNLSVLLIAVFFMASCEQAKEFHYYIQNRTHDPLNVFIQYSISAKGTQKADTLSILPGNKKKAFSHSGLGGFYTGAIDKIRFSGRDTLRQEWRNRGASRINKHFFRRRSWELVHQGDDREFYLFTVTPGDLKMDS